MGRKIPASIQNKIIRKWTEGKSRDLVSRECMISSGSVSGILREYRKKDREFDLLRVVALQLKEHNISVRSFAGLIRCRQWLKAEYFDSGKATEVEEEEGQAIMEMLSIFCFNKNMTVPEFGNEVLGCSHAAEQLGVALCDLPAHINNLKEEAIAIQAEVSSLDAKKEHLFSDYKTSEILLKEISSYSPYLLEVHSRLKDENRELREELMKCKIKIRNAEIYRRAEEKGEKGH